MRTNMVRTRDIPGPGSRIPPETTSISNYNRSRYKEDKGRYFPLAKFSLASLLMSGVDDTDYLSILLNAVDGTYATHFGTLCTDAWKFGLKTGNLKDENVTESAAFEALCEAWIEILFNLGPQMVIKDLMTNPLKSNLATNLNDGTTITALACFETEDANTLISELENLPLPKAVLGIWQAFAFYFQMIQPYTKGATHIPGAYVSPWMPTKSLTEVKTLKDAVYSNSGMARNHMDKFHIIHSNFKREDLKSRLIQIDSDDAIAYFTNACPMVSGVAAGNYVLTPEYPIDAAAGTDYNKHRLFFKNGGSPNDSKLNVLAPLIYNYLATYNKYGGVLSGHEDISVAYFNAIKAKRTGNTWAGSTYVKSNVASHFFMNFLAACADENNACISLTGAIAVAADSDLSEDYWMYAVRNDLKYWQGYTYDQWTQSLLQYMADEMF